MVKDSAPRKNSINLLSNLVDFITRLSNQQNKNNADSRSRREITVEEFNLKRRELRNLVSGIQNIISDHILQVILKFLKT